MRLLISFHFVAVLVLSVTAQLNEKCPDLFLRYSRNHSYCIPDNRNCNVQRSSVNQDDINTILREHNTLRSKIASGKEQKLPSAGNMLQMVWDNELAAVAQKHAIQCVFEHDCSNCRRVQNYGVGQNLALEQVSIGRSIPDPDWPAAIKMWYDEINFMPRTAIDPFIAPPPEPTYGHFSQLAWATSWRIGCGYVLFVEGNTHRKLYTCNYGPAGNIVSKSMYDQGAPCSKCPENSCCGESCRANFEYPGLCKITDNRAPVFSPEDSYIFYCDFQNQTDCNSYATGQNNWLLFNTMYGNYLGIVLKGGEESTMIFNNRIKPSTSSFCFVINYRKGPNLDGQQEDNTAIETFTITDSQFEVKQNLPTFSGSDKQQFNQFKMSLGWSMETEFKITFSVPPGKPEQFLEIQSIYVTEGSC